MEDFMKYFVIILIVILIIANISQAVLPFFKRDENDNKNEGIKYYPYKKKLLLTKREYAFYCKLKEVTEKNNLDILSKIRLADLIEVDNSLSEKERIKYFNMIKAKHIDFAIAKNMSIKMLIELDDNSHSKSDRRDRDDFVNNALTKAGYTFVRTYGDLQEIEKILNPPTSEVINNANT